MEPQTGGGMGVIAVFAYGSLMFEPECADDLATLLPARLKGYHRRFNKRSRTRGCPPEHVPDRPAVEGFAGHDGHRDSLVLGTERGGHIDGVALVYPQSVGPELLRRLDRREGPGYRRTKVTVTAGKRRLPAFVYATHPNSDQRIEVELPQQAEVLAAATPTGDVDGRARGAAYLFGVLEALDAIRAWDPRMEALGELVRRAIAHPNEVGYS